MNKIEILEQLIEEQSKTLANLSASVENIVQLLIWMKITHLIPKIIHIRRS